MRRMSLVVGLKTGLIFQEDSDGDFAQSLRLRKQAARTNVNIWDVLIVSAEKLFTITFIVTRT